MCEGAIAPQYGQRTVEIVEVFLLRHENQITHDEVRREVGVAPGAIALRRGGQIEAGILQEIMFSVEPGLIERLLLFSKQSSEHERRHAGVQVLTHLESDPHV